MPKKKPRNPDHVRRRNTPLADNEAITQHLKDLLSPAIYAQSSYYRSLGLRERILNLSLMVAAMLTVIWRQVPSVNELTRMLEQKELLWGKAVKVSQQALSQRFLSFPAELFERVFHDLLPLLQSRWLLREKRPLPAAVKYAKKYFENIWIADGSTLEALFRKLDSLKDVPQGKLAGKICTVIDLLTRLPVQVWFHTNPLAHDTNFLDDLINIASAKTLLVLDRGFYDFGFFLRLIAKQIDFITRIKSNAVFDVERILSYDYTLRDRVISFNTKDKHQQILRLRLIEVKQGKTWYAYVTSVLDPQILPPYVVADLYARRWRIEESFNTAKRLLGLSYLWTGSINGIKLQVWATWLFYAVLIDLADAVADELALPFDRISLEMIFRGLYHFNHAYDRGRATDPVLFFAAPENKNLDVVKTIRKKPQTLDLSPFPLPLTIPAFP
ncbi:IS4 family transposase [Brunnivagina elsteri]|uniref:IS4 family transposase n=1 Tax=Brunnivagina elsteri CCALA 953 TaxID=987040 RepID=A0A2A2TAS4_9CYAN|nr:IS4 family transposase [Calothrix elsteri]PAX49080.1 IS4 family transposase [Calothrix elsteri CCALA 953]